jgi:hypothetical protein
MVEYWITRPQIHAVMSHRPDGRVCPNNVFVISSTRERAEHRHNTTCMIAGDVVDQCRIILLPFVGRHTRGRAVFPRELHTVHTTDAIHPCSPSKTYKISTLSTSSVSLDMCTLSGKYCSTIHRVNLCKTLQAHVGRCHSLALCHA